MTYQAASGATSAESYYADPRTVHAYATLGRRAKGVLLGFLAYRSGKNAYDLQPDLEAAILRGLTALRRWWIWLFFTQVWLFWLGMTGWMSYLRFHKIRGESFQDHSGALSPWLTSSYVLLPIAFLALAVAYTRNVDYSLFKRRLAYKVVRPLTVVLDRVPSAVLYLIVVVGLFSPVAACTGTPATHGYDTGTEYVCVPGTDGVSICHDG